MQEAVPEPWLRGALPDVHPLIQPVFFSFAQVREDLAKHIAGLDREQVWRRIGGASTGFHLKHLAASVDRLTTYLTGNELSDQQLRALREEAAGSEDTDELLTLVEEALSASEKRLRELDPGRMYELRAVGRNTFQRLSSDCWCIFRSIHRGIWAKRLRRLTYCGISADVQLHATVKAKS